MGGVVIGSGGGSVLVWGFSVLDGGFGVGVWGWLDSASSRLACRAEGYAYITLYVKLEYTMINKHKCHALLLCW
jgi:hypothetical protein